MKPIVERVKLPLEIAPDRIGLPTRGARVTRCTLVRKGKRPPGRVAFLWKTKALTDYYCITGVIRPVDPKAENIRFEVGIPLQWNGKAVHQGGGGLNGYVPCATGAAVSAPHPEGLDALAKGYAVFGGDSGHNYLLLSRNTGCKWGLRREALENYAYKYLKKTYDVAMEIIEAYCGTRPERVYFCGGSNGGRECFKALANWPEDYEGAVCLFPALHISMTFLAANRNADVLERLGKEAMISQEQSDQVMEAIRNVLDSDDGTVDGFYSGENISAEQEERVLQTLRGMLSEPQIKFLRTVAEPLQLPYPLPRGEDMLAGYPALMGSPFFGYYGRKPEKRDSWLAAVGKNGLSCLAMGDPSFDSKNFDVVANREQVLELSRLLDADDCNLDRFFEKGGKILLLHGNLDPLVSITGTTRYYKRLCDKYGEKLREHLAFFYAPGYGHGDGGAMWYYTDLLGTLEEWAENGNRPQVLIAEDRNEKTKGRTRPLYEYPGYAVYTGSGDKNDAANYRQAQLK